MAPLPNCTVIVDRGPFDPAYDLTLLRDHQIEIVVTKNSGGSGSEAKLIAARTLGLKVIMINRPTLPQRPSFAAVPDILHWLAHPADLGLKT